MTTNLFSNRTVTHTPLCVCVCSAAPRRVRFSPASAGSVWPAARTPAGRCSDSDGPTAAACNKHTQNTD